MTKKRGVFVISLDLELCWGMLDKMVLEDYKENLLGVRSVVPSLLRLFDERKIHATWAVVGFLFFETRQELIRGLPTKRPKYVNGKLCPYNHINNIGSNEREDPFHYAPSLIKMIASFPHQEIGSHTFSHYYCLERGQDINTFRDDLESAAKAAKRYGLTLESLVFPRNQFNSRYIPVCKEMGIKAYRGNEPSWIYSARSEEDESILRRGLRVMDAYFNISGHNCYSMDNMGHAFPFNIPSSRFLRPYNRRLTTLEPLRLQRILSGLSHAARDGLVYHLWWHPDGFGLNLEENMSLIEKVLQHYVNLKETYGMESLTMGELSNRLSRNGRNPN